jgi:hypothetical protein
MSSQTVRARIEFIRSIVTAQNGGSTTFKPEKLMDLELTDPGDIVDAVTDVMGVTDQFAVGSPSARDTLVDYASNGGTLTSLDLFSFEGRQKLQGVFALVLIAPHFQVH